MRTLICMVLGGVIGYAIGIVTDSVVANAIAAFSITYIALEASSAH